MTLAPSTIERCLEVLGALVRAQPELNSEFEASVETFFQGPLPGAAGDVRETLLAGRRHLEWFLLEHHSAALRGSVAEKLAPAYRESVAESLVDEDDSAEQQAALGAALDALLRSHTGIFEAESAETEEAVWARDLGGFGTYAMMTTGLEGRLRHGDLLVGRLYPAGDGGNVASPTIAIVRSPEIRTALTRDLARTRDQSAVNVLRIGQRDLEAMFFGESAQLQPLEGESGARAEDTPEAAPSDPREAALAILQGAGLTDDLAQGALTALSAKPRDPEQLVHGVADPMAEVMEALAFETDLDLTAARVALLQAWDLLSAAGASATPPSGRGNKAPASSPAATAEADPDRARAVDAFSQGRERGEDAATLLQQLEEDLGISTDSPDEPGAEAPAPDFPGVVGAMVDEMRWELQATRGDFDVSSLDPLQHLAAFARPIGVFEELRGRDLFQFATFWLQETRALQSDAEALQLVAALREFCEWALDAHEVDLGSEFLDALDGLEASLPRLRQANHQLDPSPAGASPAAGSAAHEDSTVAGEGYEILAIGPDQPETFEGSSDRLRARSGGDAFTVILPAAIRGQLEVGDYLRASVTLEGHALVYCCYPPEARALMGD